MTAVVQSREHKIDAVDGNCAEAARDEHVVLCAKESGEGDLRWQAAEIGEGEAARDAVVAESGGVGGGGLSHRESEERGIGRGEEGEGGVGGGVEKIDLEVGSGDGVGEEVVAAASDNGEHRGELLGWDGGDDGVLGKEERKQKESDMAMEDRRH